MYKTFFSRYYQFKVYKSKIKHHLRKKNNGKKDCICSDINLNTF